MTIIKFIVELIGSLGFLLCGMKFMSNGVQKELQEKNYSVHLVWSPETELQGCSLDLQSQ